VLIYVKYVYYKTDFELCLNNYSRQTGMEYETAKTIHKMFDISKSTLVKWSNEHKIRCIRMFGGKRLYKKSDITNLIGGNECQPIQHTEPENIVYARVSSSHQKPDLERQIEFLKSKFPNHRIIQDIGSGLNFKRQGLLSILEQCMQGNIREIAITDKDRICRFGFELFEWIIKKYNVKLVVHSQPTQSETTPITTENEMAQDILAICNYFVAKNNGLRAQRNRRNRRDSEKCNGNNQIQVEIETEPKGVVEQVDGSISMDI